jgi:hypothetical protein
MRSATSPSFAVYATGTTQYGPSMVVSSLSQRDQRFGHIVDVRQVQQGGRVVDRDRQSWETL